MDTLFGLVSLGCLCILSIISGYQWLLAAIALCPIRNSQQSSHEHCRFVIIIPAHNEEANLPVTLSSIKSLKYPTEFFRVIVVADRCSDSTAAVAVEHGATCFERTSGEGAKGEAIAWSFQQLQKAGIEFDAVMIMDADAIVHEQVLDAFNGGLIAGYRIQQSYNYLSNPWESPFTRVIAVTSVLKTSFILGVRAGLGSAACLQVQECV